MAQTCTLAGSSRKLPGPGNDAKKKSLAELFQPPHDIIFHGSFHEVGNPQYHILYLHLFISIETGTPSWRAQAKMVTSQCTRFQGICITGS